MIGYTAARILSQVLDSQGDGTGTTNQLPAAKTVSGATNATPIVVTATGHGYSDGDFVHITGVVGTTACNDLHIVANTTTNTFELTTPAGADVAGNGSYSSGGTAYMCFVCKPAAGVTFCLHKFAGYFQGGILQRAGYYGPFTYPLASGPTLTNGVEVQVRQDTTLLHTLSPAPIKTAPLGFMLGARQLPHMEMVAGSASNFRWDFSGCAVNLDGDADEFFVVLNSDDITATGLERQVMSVHGESI
jgi:hypothetical protein